MQGPTNDCEQNRRRVSLWKLCGIALAAAVLIRIVFTVGEPRQFRSLWSLHALIAALPILGVYIIHAATPVTGRRLGLASLLIFGVALALPAIHLRGDIFGLVAFVYSFLAFHPGNWGSIPLTMGALSNLSFLVGYLAFLAFVLWQKGIRLARALATLGFCLSILVILPLAWSNDLQSVFLGYGLWVASQLALALGSWHTAAKVKTCHV